MNEKKVYELIQILKSHEGKADFYLPYYLDYSEDEIRVANESVARMGLKIRVSRGYVTFNIGEVNNGTADR